MENYDIAIIGGGASGLCAGIGAAEAARHGKICVLEKQGKPGKKILVTGNGRCNFTHVPARDGRHVGTIKPEKITDNFDARDFFMSLGTHSTVDREGRAYPYSGTAASVLEALLLRCEALGVKLILDFEISQVKPVKGGFEIFSGERMIFAKRAVITTGGGLALPEGVLASIKPISPALCPMLTDKDLVKALAGVRVKCKVSLYDGDKLLGEETGELQFSNTALSGICVFNLSLLASPGKKYQMSLDLLSDMDTNAAEKLIYRCLSARSKLPPDVQLSGIFHWKIASALLKSIGIKSSLSPRAARKIAEKAKAWSFPVMLPSDLKLGQIAKGGVLGKEINERLELIRYPGLYLAGEILDIAWECGGYNLNWAWASGLAAGKAAGEGLC